MSKVILVTGASSGIGEATALRFGRAGYAVILAARRFDRLRTVADQIQAAGGDALPVQADLCNLTDIERLVAAGINQYGKIDILFNNAGFGRLKWLDEMDPVKDIETQLSVNLSGVIQTSRAVLPYMIEQRSGHIINMGSLAGYVATPTYTIYAASKFAIRGFSEALRREVGVYGIKVSVIYTAGVDTEFKQHTGMERKTGVTTPKRLRLSADQLSQVVWSLTVNPRSNVIVPGVLRLSILFNAWFPGLFDWIIEKGFTRIERASD